MQIETLVEPNLLLLLLHYGVPAVALEGFYGQRQWPTEKGYRFV